MAVAGQRFGLCAQGCWKAVGMRGLWVVEVFHANCNTPGLCSFSWNSCPNSTFHNSFSCYTLNSSQHSNSSFMPWFTVLTKMKTQQPGPGAPTECTFPGSLIVGLLSLKIVRVSIELKKCTYSLWDRPGPASQWEEGPLCDLGRQWMAALGSNWGSWTSHTFYFCLPGTLIFSSWGSPVPGWKLRQLLDFSGRSQWLNIKHNILR